MREQLLTALEQLTPQLLDCFGAIGCDFVGYVGFSRLEYEFICQRI